LRSRKISRRTFVIGGGMAFISYMFFEVKNVAVTKYSIPISNLPSTLNGFTILHLTDLHSKEYGNDQKQLIDLINRYKFDMVAITGDFVDKGNPRTDPAINLIKGLTDKPIFFVPGNHEWWNNYKIKEQLISEGVLVLENSNHKYFKGEEHMWIIGVDDPYLGKDNLDLALEGIDDSSPRLLLAHAPNIYPSAIQSNIDLVMTGHTHGGQVRLPIIGAIVAPGQGFFPKLDYGLFSSNSTKMVINGGLGESVLPIRFHNRPEIVLITLEAINE